MASLASWIAWLTNRVKTDTISSYMKGVKSTHVDLGYDDLTVFRSPLLKRIITGARRLRGDPVTNERRPVTKDILLQVLPTFDRATEHGATMYASFCLAFAAFLRIGEFTYSARDLKDDEFDKWFLTRRSVRLFNDRLELTLPASKTDPYRKGVTLTVASTDDNACAVKALRHLIHTWPKPLTSPLFQDNGQFTRDLVIDTLRLVLKTVHLDGHYSGISFRRGAATSAKDAGLSDQEIQMLGRWKSDSYRLYITTPPSRILAVSRRHQLPPSPQR